MGLEGKQLGHYRLLSSLGSGGMGDVYLAEDLNIPRRVAIKVVRGEAAINVQANRNALRLFTREMKAIAALDHPNILTLIDFGEEMFGENTLTYMVMPYRAEGSLATWLRRQREQSQLNLAPREVAQLILQAANALQHAHEHQILHLDVKLSNFLIRERASHQPDLLLSDFGISRFTSASATASQSVRGTPAYMAPEQWEGLPVAATDQYALAVMAYQLLTDTLPFVGTQHQVMFQHLSKQPQPPSVLNPTLSQEIDEVILHALAKRPEERFLSVPVFAGALKQACQSTVSCPTGLANDVLLGNSSQRASPLAVSPVADDVNTLLAPEAPMRIAEVAQTELPHMNANPIPLTEIVQPASLDQSLPSSSAIHRQHRVPPSLLVPPTSSVPVVGHISPPASASSPAGITRQCSRPTSWWLHLKSMTPWKIFLLIGLAVVSSVGLFTFMRSNQISPVQYIQAPVTTGNISTTVSAVGPITPNATYNLNFPISGQISTINVQIGQQVTQGQVLATITPSQTNTNTANTTLTAPGNATVEAINGAVGEQIGSNGTAIPSTGSNQAFMVLVDASQLDIAALVKKVDIRNVQLGQVAQFTISTYPAEAFDASVSNI